MASNLLEVEVRRDELLASWSVDAVVTRTGDRRRADAHVNLTRSRRAHERDQPARRGAAHDRIVHHDNALAVHDLMNRVVLHFDLGVTILLRRLDERAAHVMIPYERELEGEMTLLGESQRR